MIKKNFIFTIYFVLFQLITLITYSRHIFFQQQQKDWRETNGGGIRKMQRQQKTLLRPKTQKEEKNNL